MFCPRDNTELKVSARQGVEFDYCPQCRGVWLDNGELEKLIEESHKEEDIYQQGAGFPPPGASGGYNNYPPPPAPGPYPPQGGYYPNQGGYSEHGGGKHGGGKHGGGGEHGGGYSNPYPNGQPGRKRKSFLGDIFDF